jgi:ankyrin repeat protein
LGVIDLLLDRGVDVNAATSDGLTALMVATIKGHHAVVERLLEAGAEVRMQDMFKYNALAFAERLGHDAIAELLQSSMTIAKEKNYLSRNR